VATTTTWSELGIKLKGGVRIGARRGAELRDRRLPGRGRRAAELASADSTHHPGQKAVTGDDDPAAVTQHPEAQAIRAEPSARRRAQLDAALSRKITERLLPVFKITSDAAAVDPDFAELNRAMIARRRAEMVDAANLLAGDGGLRLSPDDAAASLLVLYSPHVAQNPDRVPRMVLRPLRGLAR